MTEATLEQDAAPLFLLEEQVRPEWIDYNGHMNMAFFMVVFDRATDRLYDILDIGAAYVGRSRCSLFTLESHVVYAHELREGEPFRVTAQLLDGDAKRLHYFMRMEQSEKRFVAATGEFLAMHLELATRRPTPLPPDAVARYERILARHRTLPRPAELGRVIGIRRRG